MLSTLPPLAPGAPLPTPDSGPIRAAGETRSGFAELMQQQSALRAAAPAAATAAPDGAAAPPADGPAPAHAATGRPAGPAGASDAAARAAARISPPAERPAKTDAAVPRPVTGAAPEAADGAPQVLAPPPAALRGQAIAPTRAARAGTGPAAAEVVTSTGAATPTLPDDAEPAAALGTMVRQRPADDTTAAPPAVAAPESPPLPGWLQGQALVTGWRPATPAPAAPGARPGPAATDITPGADSAGVAAVDAAAAPGAAAAGASVPASGLRPAPTGRAMAASASAAAATAQPPGRHAANVAADAADTKPVAAPAAATATATRRPGAAAVGLAASAQAGATAASAAEQRRDEPAVEQPRPEDPATATLSPADVTALGVAPWAPPQRAARPAAESPATSMDNAAVARAGIVDVRATSAAPAQGLAGYHPVDPAAAAAEAGTAARVARAGTTAPRDAQPVPQVAAHDPDAPVEQAVPLTRRPGLARPTEHAAEGAGAPLAMLAAASIDRGPTAADDAGADGAAPPSLDRGERARGPQPAQAAPAAAPADTAAPAAGAGRNAAQPASADSREPALRVESTRPTASGPLAAVLPAPVAAGAAAGALPGGGAAGPAHALAESQIRLPLDHPGFAPALGAQISLFARDGVQTARLQLNPAEMGPITVQISLDGSAARVDFQADLAGTRSVIEASLPALAGALQDAGMTLAGGGVSQQPSGQRQTPEPPPGSMARRAGEGGSLDTTSTAPAALPARRRGLVDLVA